MRTVHCDFCNAVLTESGWECMCRSFDYHAQRQSLDPDNPVVVDGSIGSWLACDTCAVLVKGNEREALARRGAQVNADAMPGISIETVIRDVVTLHAGFWDNHTGDVIALTAEKIAEIATEPNTTTEWRPM